MCKVITWASLREGDVFYSEDTSTVIDRDEVYIVTHEGHKIWALVSDKMFNKRTDDQEVWSYKVIRRI